MATNMYGMPVFRKVNNGNMIPRRGKCTAAKILILTIGHTLGDILLNAVKEKSTRRACVEREGFRKAPQGLGLEESWHGAAENHS